MGKRVKGFGKKCGVFVVLWLLAGFLILSRVEAGGKYDNRWMIGGSYFPYYQISDMDAVQGQGFYLRYYGLETPGTRAGKGVVGLAFSIDNFEPSASESTAGIILDVETEVTSYTISLIGGGWKSFTPDIKGTLYCGVGLGYNVMGDVEASASIGGEPVSVEVDIKSFLSLPLFAGGDILFGEHFTLNAEIGYAFANTEEKVAAEYRGRRAEATEDVDSDAGYFRLTASLCF